MTTRVYLAGTLYKCDRCGSASLRLSDSSTCSRNYGAFHSSCLFDQTKNVYYILYVYTYLIKHRTHFKWHNYNHQHGVIRHSFGSVPGITNLAPYWATNGTNMGLFQIRFQYIWLGDLKKSTGFFRFGSNLTHFEAKSNIPGHYSMSHIVVVT